MVRLWTRMGLLFGADNWVRRYGEDPSAEWSQALRHKTVRQIATGVQACIDAALEFPPTLPQFKKLCREEDSWPAASYSSPPMPSGGGTQGLLDHLGQQALSDTAKHELEKCKAMLRGEGVELSANPPVVVGGKSLYRRKKAG